MSNLRLIVKRTWGPIPDAGASEHITYHTYDIDAPPELLAELQSKGHHEWSVVVSAEIMEEPCQTK